MNFEEARRHVLERARSLGAHAEVFAQRTTTTTVKPFGGEVDEFKFAERAGIGVRALVNGAWGHAYTEKLDAAALDRALDSAVANAALARPDEHARLGAWPEPPEVSDLHGEGLSTVDVDRKVNAALALERAARDADPRVTTVAYAQYHDERLEVNVANTEGLDRAYTASAAVQFVMPIVVDGDGAAPKSAPEYQVTREFADLDPSRTALEAVRKSVAMLGAEPAPSGRYAAVIQRECFATLLATFAPMFNARLAQEGKSPLRDRAGQRVANDLVTIVDDATLPGGLASRPFDAEGYPSRRVTLLERGTFKAFLHNTATAARAGVESTGHASRRGYRDVIGVAPTNLFLEPGDGGDVDALVAGLESGVLVTAVHGTHAGANAVTGDFSLQADGFLVRDGKVAHALEVFTVAGNFLELLEHVDAVGADLRFSAGGTGAPSVRVQSISIGGK